MIHFQNYSIYKLIHIFTDYIKKFAKKEKALFDGEKVKELKNSIEVPPQREMGDFAFPCFKLAKTLRTQGEFAAAAYDFIELAKTQTNLKADCYVQAGDIMNILGLFDNSINYYQLALNENPKKEEIQLKLARVYERAGKIDEAAKAYENICENSEENSDILYSLENIWNSKS